VQMVGDGSKGVGAALPSFGHMLQWFGFLKCQQKMTAA
jgi:hypothetical protein